jgi:hypothetical protein
MLFHQGGTFTDTLAVGITGPSWSFVVGDFNNDRITDLFVVAAGGTGQAYLGKGDGTFAAGGNPIAASGDFLVTPPFVAGDFDHDGNMDIVEQYRWVGTIRLRRNTTILGASVGCIDPSLSRPVWKSKSKAS